VSKDDQVFAFELLNVDVDNDKWHGSTRLDYDGAFVYVSASW
jgi:hypothetical protein